MKKLAILVLVAFGAMGCAVTDYPVIFDARGADDGVMYGQYDRAYIVPTSQIATLWDDGSDELFTLVSQDWRGDQWLKTYNNFDPTSMVLFLDQVYCDPVFNDTECAVVTSWNPDLPNVYPHGDQSAGYNNVDDPFDYLAGTDCSGFRSLSLLLSDTARIGECGSGIFTDRQNAAYEFSLLDKVTFRGRTAYHLPIDSSVASFRLNGHDMPLYGRFNGYLDDDFRLALPVTPNARYQLNALRRAIERDGHFLDVDLTYGSLNANFKVYVTTVDSALDRF